MYDVLIDNPIGYTVQARFTSGKSREATISTAETIKNKVSLEKKFQLTCSEGSYKDLLKIEDQPTDTTLTQILLSPGIALKKGAPR
jgi:hypothetical protein